VAVPAPILGGVRSYGALDRTEYGILNLQTDKSASFPARNFTVGRFRKNFWQNSYAGAILTHRQDTAGGDGSNTAAGIDAKMATADGRLGVDAFVAASRAEPDPNTLPLSGSNEQIQGDGAAARFGIFRVTEDWDVSHSSLFLSDDFNPAVGFVQRRGVLREAFEAIRAFRLPERNIRKLSLIASGGFFVADEIDEILDYSAGPAISLQTNGGYLASLEYVFASDKVLTPFDIEDEVTIPAGRFDSHLVTVTGATPSKYQVSGALAYTFGDYFGGTLHQFGPDLSLQPWHGLSARTIATISRLDFAQFQSDFVAAAVNSAVSYSFTTSMYFDLNLGFNTADDEVLLQYRYRWRFRPLSDFFIVLSEERASDSFASRFRSLIFKVVVFASI
jgi:hypothetical protein